MLNLDNIRDQLRRESDREAMATIAEIVQWHMQPFRIGTLSMWSEPYGPGGDRLLFRISLFPEVTVAVHPGDYAKSVYQDLVQAVGEEAGLSFRAIREPIPDNVELGEN